MMYEEFEKITGCNDKQLTVDYNKYTYDIEPAYRHLDIDKYQFCKFWEKNKEIVTLMGKEFLRMETICKKGSEAINQLNELNHVCSSLHEVIEAMEQASGLNALEVMVNKEVETFRAERTAVWMKRINA